MSPVYESRAVDFLGFFFFFLLENQAETIVFHSFQAKLSLHNDEEVVGTEGTSSELNCTATFYQPANAEEYPISMEIRDYSGNALLPAYQGDVLGGEHLQPRPLPFHTGH